jgi:hypothetical protein
MGFHWKLSAAFVALFVVGALCGSVLTYSFTAPRGAKGWKSAQNWAPGLFRQLESEVKLTPEQVASFRPEIEEAIRKVKNARRQALIESDLEIDAVLARIGNQLEPDQKLRMEQFRAKRRARVLRWIARRLQ